jgi:hypothetical protein
MSAVLARSLVIAVALVALTMVLGALAGGPGPSDTPSQLVAPIATAATLSALVLALRVASRRR